MGKVRNVFCLCFILIFSIVLPNALHAATFTVNNTGDGADANADGICETGVGNGICTFRAALQEANDIVGADTIQFSIGGGGFQTITPTSALPTIEGDLIINATTQPGFAGVPLISVTGTSAGSGAEGLTIIGSNVTVRGLVINSFNGDGILLSGDVQNCVIEGNYIGTNFNGSIAQGNAGSGVHIVGGSSNRIGGSTVAARNVISGNLNGVLIESSDYADIDAIGNLVQGNYIGLGANGLNFVGNTGRGVHVLSANNTSIGGSTAGARNVISGNGNHGILISRGTDGSSSEGTVVQGNFIGTNSAGTAARGNLGDGVVVDTALNTAIGGLSAGQGNVISGNSGSGIVVKTEEVLPFPPAGTSIQGNFIGTDNIQLNVISNGKMGIHLSANTHHSIVQGNSVFFSSLSGIRVDTASNENSLRQNETTFNGFPSDAGLGIDLGGVGVTPNDPGDADGGANTQQNFPFLTVAGLPDGFGGNITIQGTLDSTPNSTFVIDLFSSSFCDSSSHGEGRNYLQSLEVTTDSLGHAAFSTSFLWDGEFNYTATASQGSLGTETTNTSEFSRCAFLTFCFDFVCDPLETVANCSSDCNTATCGNGICGENENTVVCPQDCPTGVCGDGICQTGAGEKPNNCPSDCTCASAPWFGFNAYACDDGNPCTHIGSCSGSTCITNNVPNGIACSDQDDFCLGEGVCQTGVCQLANPVTCEPGDQCMDAGECDPASGLCASPSPKPDGTACDDGNLCTTEDECSGGSCGGSPACDDGNDCNGTQICNPSNGACEDATPPVDCDDHNPCTSDSCDPETGQCSHEPVADGTSCSDDNACNGAETCHAGECQPGSAPDCDDHNVCTDDDCDPGSGCTHVNNNDPCDDGNACTGSDTCSGGACAGTPVHCDDGNVCNGAETCDPSSGCQPGTPLDCQDGNACNGVETCHPTMGCQSGTPPNCDDFNPCTADTCDSLNGCVHTPLPDSDGDGDCDAEDPCPHDPENDADNDGVCGDEDNCPDVANPDQADEDHDGIGDACDEPQDNCDCCADTDITAKLFYKPLKWIIGEFCGCRKIKIPLPSHLQVVEGNAGNNWASIAFFQNHHPVGCFYKGGANSSHPTSPSQIAKGLKYNFSYCTNGMRPGQMMNTSKIALVVLSGDSQSPNKFNPRTVVTMPIVENPSTGCDVCSEPGGEGECSHH
jgi:hypothetical protein